MARNLNDLAMSMFAKAKSIEKIASDKAVRVAIHLETLLVYSTPVDTSQALSNWQVSLVSPVGTFINPYVPGYLGYTQYASAEAAIAAARSVLASKKPGQTIYISNNAPYIADLNRGTSRQAPSGFVQADVMRTRLALPTI